MGAKLAECGVQPRLFALFGALCHPDPVYRRARLARLCVGPLAGKEKRAGVEPGKIYSSRAEAAADAKLLSRENGVGFKVIALGNHNPV